MKCSRFFDIPETCGTSCNAGRLLLLLLLFVLPGTLAAAEPLSPSSKAEDIVFQIGRPDAVSWEFRKTLDWVTSRDANGLVYRFDASTQKAKDWVPAHYGTRDFGAAGLSFTTEIEFQASRDYDQTLYLVLGFCFVSHMEPSLIHVSTNGIASKPVRQPDTPNDYGYKWSEVGIFESLVIEIPAGAVRQGRNVLSIRLDDGSFYVYDYLMLRERNEVPVQLAIPDLLSEFRRGPMKEVRRILFAVRKPGHDPHWYSNFGYYADDENEFPFPLGSGGMLRILDLDTGDVREIFRDDHGNVRDPQVHYDAGKVLFSYLPAGKRHYNLYEINIDGTGLKQLTFGDWDDIEPTYTASGHIIFCSTRSKRWVQCAASPVATLFRCDPDGGNIRPLSANPDQDNTPWPLPDGRIIYMRWDYIDRSQMDYHHLWTMNPDGTRQSVFYGNYHPGKVMLAPKPIPDSPKIVATFSPGHGIREHYGNIAVVDPRNGPDDLNAAEEISSGFRHCDPWAFSETAFMAASQARLQLVDGNGYEQTIYELPETLREKGFWIGEPRPVIERPRERVIGDSTDGSRETGRLALVDIYQGRRLKSLPKGSVKDLLILEPLPAPIHYNGGMEMITNGGTFMLTRIVGTVPVQPDGSAYMELPANRSFLFVARDREENSIKRMHSFTSVMPGETTVCIGCHEHRTETPDTRSTAHLMRRMHREPDRPKPVEGVPEIFDFPRDIQPILDRHCIECHHHDRAEGGFNFVGDWEPIYSTSYRQLSRRDMLGDNRNRIKSDLALYEVGTRASRLVRLVEEKHAGVELSPEEIRMIRYWIEVGANYAGTYAANYTGVVGYHYNFGYTSHDEAWPETGAMAEAIERRCTSCHDGKLQRTLPHRISQEGTGYSRHHLFNLSRPEKSRILRAPLPVDQGGTGRCSGTIFADTDDSDYRLILAGIERARRYILEESNRFDMNPFIPNHSYVREMKRYGILPADLPPRTPIDPYRTDLLYWKNLHESPADVSATPNP